MREHLYESMTCNNIKDILYKESSYYSGDWLIATLSDVCTVV